MLTCVETISKLKKRRIKGAGASEFQKRDSPLQANMRWYCSRKGGSYGRIRSLSCYRWFYSHPEEKSRNIWAAAWQNNRPAKTQISLDIRIVWSESSLCAEWVAKDPRCLHADSEDWSDWADAQADRSLPWAHVPFCWFSLVAAHLPSCYTPICFPVLDPISASFLSPLTVRIDRVLFIFWYQWLLVWVSLCPIKGMIYGCKKWTDVILYRQYLRCYTFLIAKMFHIDRRINFFFVTTWLPAVWSVSWWWNIQLSLVMRKCVFGGLRPGKTQTGLLTYRVYSSRVLKLWI